jgi:hypothetical protein
MSCVLALAIPQFALVCADTRLNVSFRDSKQRVHDGGSITFDYPDGRQMHIEEAYRKIRRYHWGWATGGGSFPLVSACLNRLQQISNYDSRSVHAALQGAYQTEVPIINSDFGTAQPGIDRTAILMIYSDRNTLKLDGIRFNGEKVVPPGAHYVLATPPDIPDLDKQRVNVILENGLNDSRSFIDVLKVLANVFHEVHMSSMTVSDRLEVGIMELTPTGVREFHVGADNAYLIGGEDKEISKLLRPL